MSEWALVEMLETREGDETDREGHEDHPENITF